MEKSMRFIAAMLAVILTAFLFGCRGKTDPFDSKQSDNTSVSDQAQTHAQSETPSITTHTGATTAAVSDTTEKPTTVAEGTSSESIETTAEVPPNKVIKFKITLDWVRGNQVIKQNAALIEADIELSPDLDQRFIQYSINARHGSFVVIEDSNTKQLGSVAHVNSLDNLYWIPDENSDRGGNLTFSIVQAVEGYTPQTIEMAFKYVSYDKESGAFYTYDNEGFPTAINEVDGTYVLPEIFSIEDNLIEEYLKKYGDNYTIKETEEFKVYIYKSGLKLYEKDGRVTKFSTGNIQFTATDDKVKNNVLANTDGELIFITGRDNYLYGGFIVYDTGRQSIIVRQEPLYVRENPVKLIDIDSDGTFELSFSGIKKETEESEEIYTTEIISINEDGLSILFGKHNPEKYSYLIDFTLEDQLFTIMLPQVNAMQKCSLPDRLFTEEILNDDEEIRISLSYLVRETETSPYVECSFTVIYPIGGEWYGPGYSIYEMHFCSLATGTLKLQYNDSKWNIREYTLKCKFDEEGENIGRLTRDEAYFGDHVISQGDQVRDVIVRMGGNLEDYNDEELDEYLAETTVDNCNIKMFTGGDIYSFEIFTSKYPSSRGLKVGDTRERVLELYGNPDLGFVDDSDYIAYYMGYETSRHFYIHFDGNFVKSMGIYEFATD